MLAFLADLPIKEKIMPEENTTTEEGTEETTTEGGEE